MSGVLTGLCLYITLITKGLYCIWGLILNQCGGLGMKEKTALRIAYCTLITCFEVQTIQM